MIEKPAAGRIVSAFSIMQYDLRLFIGQQTIAPQQQLLAQAAWSVAAIVFPCPLAADATFIPEHAVRDLIADLHGSRQGTRSTKTPDYSIRVVVDRSARSAKASPCHAAGLVC